MSKKPSVSVPRHNAYRGWRPRVRNIALGADEEQRSRIVERTSTPIATFLCIEFFLAAALGQLGRLDEARSAVQAGIGTRSDLHHFRFRVGASSDNPTFLARRERLCEGMRKAGVPEIEAEFEGSLRERARCSSLVDWPAYPRLRGIRQVLNAHAQFGPTNGSSGSCAVRRSLFGRCCLRPAEAVVDLRQRRFQSSFWLKPNVVRSARSRATGFARVRPGRRLVDLLT